MNAPPGGPGQIAEELYNQLRALGYEHERAAELAKEKAADLTGDESHQPPYYVLPHASGWVVARAHSVSERDVFATREEALRRGEELAEAAGTRLIVITGGDGDLQEPL